MTPERVGVMGFGRIGRSLFRLLYQHDDIRIAAISDIADHAGLEYLLRFDTILGRFPDVVSIRDGNLYAAGHPTRMLSGANPGDVDWGELGVTTVVESTAVGRSREEIEKHLERGARRVILCVPLVGRPDLTVVQGVNDGRLRREHRIVSNASNTAHCAAPVLKLLDDAFGIERAFLTTVHAYTNQQRLADVPSRRPAARAGGGGEHHPAGDQRRRGVDRTAPRAARAAHRLGDQRAGARRLGGRPGHLAPRPGDPDGDQRGRPHRRLDRPLARILAYESEPIVSSDIVRSAYSSTFDAQATMVLGERVSKTLAWFDNGWGYAHRVVDLIGRFIELDREAA